MRNMYCSLCGVVLQPIRDAQSPKDSLPWTQKARAVYLRRGISDPAITGLGYLNDRLELRAPATRAASCYQEDEEINTWRLCQPATDGWIFAFHNACWQLLLTRTGCMHHSESARLARILFNIFYCTPLTRHWVLIPGHDYGGVAQVQHPYGNIPLLARADSRCGYILADPMEPFLDRVTIGTVAAEAISDISPEQTRSNHHDGFTQLPNEVIIYILTLLPSRDVCQLRLSSRRIAAITAPEKLPQNFWASRFQPEFEIGFAFACLTPPERGFDWHHLYVTSKLALSGRHPVPGYKNKHRIWQCLQELSQFITNDLPSALNPRADCTSNLSLNTARSLGGRTFGCIISGAMMTESDADEPLRIGCRRLETRQLLWRSTSDVAKLDVGLSFITLSTCRYISGLCIRVTRTDTTQSSLLAVGRIIKSTEQWLYGINLMDLEAIMAAANISGILGLKFLTRSKENEVRTVGDLDTSIPGVGIGALNKPVGWRIDGISVGFDAFKAVSIQLIGSHQQNNESEVLVPVGELCPNPPVYQTLWSPCFPNNAKSTMSIPSVTRNRNFNLSLSMAFGGATGALLSSLQRITAVMFDRGDEFLGFKFFYTDNTRLFTAVRDLKQDGLAIGTALEVSFPIDGRYGERISAVEVLHCPSVANGTVLAVKIRTSWGNNKTFRFNDEDSRQLCSDAVWSTLESPGDLISGFTALTRPSTGAFQTFGIQTTLCKSRPHPTESPGRLPSPIAYAAQERTGSIVLNRRGSVVVQASLRNVRQIRLSSGGPGYCRDSQHISGLMVEYFDQRPPEFLGQWINEVSIWQFAGAEKFVKITFWTTAEAESFYGKAKLGKVIAVRFETTTSTYQQYMSQLNGAVEVNFRANPYEQLTDINWTFNVDYDHPRVLYSPSSKWSGFELILFDGFPSWVVSKKALWIDCDSQGAESSIQSIKIRHDCSGISGISFHYVSGAAHAIGVQSGETATLTISSGEQLVRIVVGYGCNSKLRGLTLSTDRGNGIRIEKGQPSLQRSYSLHRSWNPSPSNNTNNVFAFPADVDRFAGFWGTEMRLDQTLSSFGPIFLKYNQNDIGL